MISEGESIGLLPIVRVTIGIGLLPNLRTIRGPNDDPFRVSTSRSAQVIFSDLSEPVLSGCRVLKDGSMKDSTDGGLPDVLLP